MKLVMIRHGQSQWNLENRFTGWKDVDLSEQGIEEENRSAREQGKQRILQLQTDMKNKIKSM